MKPHNVNYDFYLSLNTYKSNAYKLIFIVFCIILFNNELHSQTTKNLTLENFKNSELKKIDTLIYQIQNKKSLGYLNLLPNVQYHYNPINNQSYVSVGISLNSYANYFQQKHRNKIEIQKIKNTLLERLSTKINRLENEYEKITLDIELLQSKVSNFQLINKIFNLKKKQYEKNKINLESWLKLQLDYQQQKINIKSKYNSINRRIKNFYKKTNSPISKIPNELKVLNSNILTNVI